MNKKTICLVIFIGLFCLALPALAIVQIPDPLNLGPGGFVTLLGRITTGVGTFIAALGTIMLIVAGILYLTSAGSPERITKAKTALFYAIVGIAIGVAASTIANIILGILRTPTSP